jgi:hypothetical protein
MSLDMTSSIDGPDMNGDRAAPASLQGSRRVFVFFCPVDSPRCVLRVFTRQTR